GEPIVRQITGPTHHCQVVAALGLLDETMNRCLIEDLPDCHRPTGIDDRKQSLAPLLNFGLGGPAAFYVARVINRGSHRAASGRLSAALAARRGAGAASAFFRGRPGRGRTPLAMNCRTSPARYLTRPPRIVVHFRG